jgi:hypothetical protein
LSSADTESGDQDGASVFEAGFNHCFQGFNTFFSFLVDFVSVGTLSGYTVNTTTVNNLYIRLSI